MAIKAVVYFVDYNLNTPDGPGINESCFIKELSGLLGAKNVIVFSRGNHDLPCEFYELSGKQKLSFSYLWGSWKNFKAFKSVVSRHPQAVVIMRQTGIGLPEFLFSLTGGRYVLKASYGKVDRYECSFLYQKIVRFFLLAMHQYVFKRALAIDVQSETGARIYERETGRKSCLVVSNGFDDELFFPKSHLSQSKNFPVIGFMGSFPFGRGGKEVVTAVHLLRKKYQGISGIVIGDNGEADEIRAYAKSLGVLDRVEIPGERPYSEMPEYVRRMTVGISLWENERIIKTYGHFSQKTRQYLACGVPVVGTLGELFLEENNLGVCLRSNTPESLITTVERCIELSQDPRATKRCAEFAKKHFSNRMLTEKRLQFWQSILDAEEEMGRSSSASRR